MANNADGTDGTGRRATKSGKSVLSGTEAGTYGGTSSRGISDASKTVSGKNDGSYGTRTGKSSSRFPADIDGNGVDRGVSHSGGSW